MCVRRGEWVSLVSQCNSFINLRNGHKFYRNMTSATSITVHSTSDADICPNIRNHDWKYFSPNLGGARVVKLVTQSRA